jgi:cyclopropane fatty-acyl-phospholipid synthase-like methyltransferase
MKSSDVKDIYDESYFLGQVDGYNEFSDFNATADSLFDRYKLNIKALDLQPADKYLEIGCGRGEIVMFHSKQGGVALGVDFSADAIALANAKKEEIGLECEFKACSFAEIESDIKWDKILASEFIEHISEEEGVNFFEKAHQLLRIGGRLVVYTYPNTLQRSYGYPLARLYNLLIKRKLLPKIPDDMLHEHYKKFHLNEQSIFSLKKYAIKSEFKIRYIGYDNPISKSLIGRLIDISPFRHILRKNLLLVAEK